MFDVDWVLVLAGSAACWCGGGVDAMMAARTNRSPPMITLHHLEHLRSQRVQWMIEELGQDYRIKRYKRDPETRLAPASL